MLDVYVEKGNLVRMGDKLAELDVAALYRQLAQAALAVETANTELESAGADLAYNLARARINLQLEQIALEKLKGYDSRVDLAVVKVELEQSTLELQATQAAYDAVSHVPNIAMRPEAKALRQATLSHARAQAAYDQAVRQASQRVYDIETQSRRIERSRLDVDRLGAGVDPRLVQAVTKAELQLTDLQAQITDTLILAPFDGEITAVSTSAGNAVEGFKPVIIIADPSELEVRAELSTEEMQKLSEGQVATIIPVEYPGQEVPSVIRSLPYPFGVWRWNWRSRRQGPGNAPIG